MFNKLKSLFGGSNEAEFDPLNIRLFDLNVGSVVDYKTSTYLVEEEYVYDWGDEDFSKELLLSNGSEKFWLSIEDEKSTSLFIHEKIRLRELGTDLPEEM